MSPFSVRAAAAAARYGWSCCQPGGTLTVTNSTLTANTVAGGTGGTGRNDNFNGNGAAGQGLGGGIFSLNGNVTITNSTISSNTAAQGGRGIYVRGAAVSGITGSTATVAMVNTIVGQTSATITDYAQTGTTVLSGANNIIRNNAGFAGGGVTGTLTADPLLSALASNGGPTQTMALPVTSPARRGHSGGPPSTDQRGYPRPTAIDIGAWQSLSSAVGIVVSPATTTPPGQVVNFIVTLPRPR